MSSIIVYGDSTSSKRVITRETVPTPSNFYGDSKLQAEKGLDPLGDTNFKIAIIRPPMIYGKGSKGNYPRLSKLAQKTPIFPDFDNQRSMLHIDNLCEFLKLMINNNESGVFFPQNKEYVRTTELVIEIAKYHGKHPLIVSFFNKIITKLFKWSITNKMFGNLVYEKEISKYIKDYNVVSFLESLNLTEEQNK